MTRQLTDSEIEKIVGVLTGWKGPLSWEALSKKCQDIIFRCPSRQTLASKVRILAAFNASKDRIKAGSDDRMSNITVRAAQDRILRLSNQVSQLEIENRLLLEQFVRWQYNAKIFGLSADQLNRALPTIDLGQS